MTVGMVDLEALVREISTKDPFRTEADVQSGIRTLLLYGGLNLDDAQVKLESPAPDRKRIDVEIGCSVIEVKKDLLVGNVQAQGVLQLQDYVVQRVEARGMRYTGILTDGASWELYSLNGSGVLELVSTYTVNPAAPDPRRLTVWLETVLATTEGVIPSPMQIRDRLGAESAGFRLDIAELSAVFEICRDLPEVKVKRELWGRLLSAALGSNFTDDDALFVEHTYLVLVAEAIAHGVAGFDLAAESLQPIALVTGAKFRASGITGVVDEDFFDWPVSDIRGQRLVTQLTKRLGRFVWSAVEHDVLKVLYESVITAETRKRLGEYYTPDWLAEVIVANVVTDPANQRVLDPACGSGTFLFWAVRRAAEALEAKGVTGADLIESVTARVFGIDLHPVAVTLARVTYLLALGPTRLKERRALSVPVYLGDSIQLAQKTSVMTAGGIEILADPDLKLFADSLFFPESVVSSSASFDQFMSEIAAKASNRAKGSSPPSIVGIMNRFGVPERDRAAVLDSFRLLCELHNHGRDHIWGYYVRNLARPLEFTRPEHQVDCLVGNPPWLAARFMDDSMRTTFDAMSSARNIRTGHHAQRDLSALFVVRAVELYLRKDGAFGFVMPLGVLSRNHYRGFRKGRFSSPGAAVDVAFGKPWDLSAIKPNPFPMPASVIFGRRTDAAAADLPPATSFWSGTIPDHYRSWSEVAGLLSQTGGDSTVVDLVWSSPYGNRFRTGAPLYPRVLLFVGPQSSGPLGVPMGMKSIVSRRSMHAPWRSVDPLTGVVESDCVRPVHLGETVLPYRSLTPESVCIPWVGRRLVEGSDPAIESLPGLAHWWREAEAKWVEYKPKTSRLSLTEKINYVKSLETQFPTAAQRVVYTKAGNRIAACRLTDGISLVENRLYWATVASEAEGTYLCALLNSTTLGDLVRPFQVLGLFGPRDFDKYIWKVAVPEFDITKPSHLELARLGKEAEELAAAVSIPVKTKFQTARRLVRSAIDSSTTGQAIEKAVLRLLS